MFCRAVSFVTCARLSYLVGTRDHFVRIRGLRLLAVQVTGRGHGGRVNRKGLFLIASTLFRISKFGSRSTSTRRRLRTRRDEGTDQEITSNRIRKRTKDYKMRSETWQSKRTQGRETGW